MEERKIEISIRSRIIIDDTIAYGSGVSALLQATDRLQSLHAASKELNMTYRKALQIVKRAEEILQQKIVRKQIGGSGGGGSELTDFGRKLVHQFCLFEKDIQLFAENKVEYYMREFLAESNT